jgi:hypothetical protein
MNYKFLGRIPVELLQDIKTEILKKVDEAPTSYRIIQIDSKIVKQFHQLLFPKDFDNELFSVHHSKVFISPPGTGCRWIHKDGIDKKCALNVIVECNSTDWVRWYHDVPDGKITQSTSTNIVSRDLTNIQMPETIIPDEEVTNQQPGDFYLINTDVFHFFRNCGSNYRLLIQTKFSPNPSIDEVYNRIQQVGLNGLYLQ